ncbi:MAG: hypothetical protein KIT89_13340 [Microcella sp.]|uniref:hypothetical protein n=1 Tax=Microcella sp. TaxID=1913979 RepID=UPI0024C661AA|nr:hypothetical protein [Microcella sp.]UYN83635.1 MAG: hypothetical protein KIT89_13340 [Microcella sp.]
MMPVTSRLLGCLTALALTLPLAACSGAGPDGSGDLDGCLSGDRGTIALGVTNSSNDPIAISNIDLGESQGVAVTDRFLAVDDAARETAVIVSDRGRDAFGGVDLDRAPLEPGASAYLGIEVARSGPGEARVASLVVTTDGAQQGVPVTLVLGEACD